MTWFRHYVRYPFLEVVYGIQNFWKFRKIIYRDRWFDHSFIIDLLVFKLEDMEKHWVKDTIHEGDSFEKGRLRIIISRLKNFEEESETLMYDYVVHKRYSKEEYKRLRNDLIKKTFLVFGKNIHRFWD